MELKLIGNKLIFNRKLSILDQFVIDFIRVLEKCHVKYVVVSGYIAIVFGRSRNTEDIDIIVEKLGKRKFTKVWSTIIKSYECLNTLDLNSAYIDYLSEGSALRFSKKGKYIPNIEFKFADEPVSRMAIRTALCLILNGNCINISRLELQIAYKMYLGSDKDLEDAKFLFELFEDKLNNSKLYNFLKAFKIRKILIKRYLKVLK